LLATFAFAVVGARIAVSRNMDYGGITLVAAVASLSGGTFRNLFLREQTPWLLNPWLFASILIAVVLTIALRQKGAVGRFALSLDTFGLAVATVSSTNFALSLNANFVGASVLGVIGGVTGGLLRDVLCQVEPVLLHRETIGTSCLAGALTYSLMDRLNASTWIAALVAGTIVILVREISIKFNLNLPKIK
jgi:uncharacterized membrane protein YeiH